MAKKANIKIPKAVLDFPEKDREAVIEVLREHMQLPKTKTLPKPAMSEHNMWESSGDDLLSQAEDDFYVDMVTIEAERLAHLMDGLGLPVLEDDEAKKAFSDEFFHWEDDLQKGNSKLRISELINRSREKRKRFLKWVEDKKTMTREQMKQIDDTLKQQLPDFGKKAEELMTRAGFIGKIRDRAERENFETLGAFVDRFPQSIETGEKEGVVLTTRQKRKEEAKGNKVQILPLTKQETEAVQHATHHAGDKITEVSARHQAGIRQLVIQAKRERWSADELARKLYDKFGEHNRDWRRVAITELGFAVNDAYLSNLEEGERVIGMGSPNACKHCKSLVIGREFTVTHKVPKQDSYNSDMKIVWPGKTNYGRRVPEYRACIPLHPNCRCRWHRISRFYKTEGNGKLKRKTTAELIQEEREKRGLPPDPNIEKKLERIRNP